MFSNDLNVKIWERELKGDCDENFLIQGVTHGFKLVDDNCSPLKGECNNYLSATDSSVKRLVENQIIDEIVNGRYVVTSKRPTIISALGAIPKKGSSEVRLIHDCSRPVGVSLNDLASKDSVKYQTLEEAITLTKPNCFYAKIDLKSAYRSVRIHPSDYNLTGLKWVFEGETDPVYLVDQRLPFGARKSPAIFHRLTQAVRRFMAKRNFHDLVVYLDDFLIISPSMDDCLETMRVLIALLGELGFAINWNKVEGPSQKITFLGIELNSIDMSLCLPKDKLNELFQTLVDFSSKTRASKRQLQSLAGKLNWACRVIQGGRVYLRRVLNAINSLNHPHHKVRLSKVVRADIDLWLNHMYLFNNTFMLSKPLLQDHVTVDACNIGAGIAYGTDWAYIRWEEDWPAVANLHINYKEVLAIILAAFRWGHLWANAKIQILTDSECARYILRKGTSRNDTIMECIRSLFWLRVKFDFEMDIYHLPGRENTLADAISRLHEPGRFLQLEALRNNYYGLPLIPCHLRFHMSTKAIFSLILQILGWLHKKGNWIRT